MKLFKAKSRRVNGGAPYITIPKNIALEVGKDTTINWSEYDYILGLPDGPSIYAPGTLYSQYTAIYSVMNTERSNAFIDSIPEAIKEAELKVLVLGMLADGNVSICEFTTRVSGSSWISSINYYAGNNIGITFKSLKSLTGPVYIVNTDEYTDTIITASPR